MSRPAYHFTPPRFWMNDPNGLVFIDDEYHLFYQHNPAASEWGNIGWGHAVSSDLACWTHLPAALSATEQSMAFSGSAVVDLMNTSGLSSSDEPPVVLIYTNQSTVNGKVRQAQHIAWSIDRGRSWHEFENNPVLDIGSESFRDPKVFWHEASSRWIMVAVVADDRIVQIYTSKNLLDWTYQSSFEPGGATAGECECPDLFTLPVDGHPECRKWLLKVDSTLGGVAGGSGGRYFIGDFDGQRFRTDGAAGQGRPVDFGSDFYAAMSWSNLPARRGPIWLGWMSNWRYAAKTPTQPWRGVQSFPRDLRLVCLGDELKLAQQPAAEIEKLRRRHRRWAGLPLTAGSSRVLEDSHNESLELDVQLAVASDARVALRLSRSVGAHTTIRYDSSAGELSVDRRFTADEPFHPDFPATHSGPLPAANGVVRIRALLDHCCLEVFGGRGETVISDLVFPDGQPGNVEIVCEQGTAVIERLDLWHLDALPKPSAPESHA